jgi:hypothetical protein
LESQISNNIEAYVDDVVIKTTVEDNLIANLVQTFANLHLYRWKLNPEKCVFRVPSGKLLGFMVSHRGVEENLTKVDAIHKMKRPTGNKDVMKFTGMTASLGRFISNLGEKSLPFFKLLKKVDGGGRPGPGGVEDLPHNAPSDGAPDTEGNSAT